MTVFAAMFAESAIPSLMGINGQAVSFMSAPGASPLALTALVGNEERVEGRDDDGRTVTLERSVTVCRDAAGAFGGVAAPRLDAEIAVEGATYAVVSVTQQSEGLATLTVRRRIAAERSRENLRRA